MKKSMRIGGNVLLVVTVMLSLLSCSDQIETHDKKQNVALIVKMKHGDYWKTVKMGAEVAAKEFDVNLNFYAPDYEEDINGQISLVNQAIKDGTDAMILAASEDQLLSQEKEQSGNLPIPVIAIDSELKSPLVKSFIGTDNYDSGKKAGEKLVELVGTSSRIAIVGFTTGTRNAEEREKGLLEVIAHYPQVEIVAKEYGFSDQKLASDLIQKLVANHKNLDGIIALDATASIGVAKELEILGLAGKVKVVAIDSPLEVLEYIQEGVIQATIIQKPFSMGYLGVKYAVEIMNGTVIPERVDTGTKVIDLENMFWSENQKLLFPFVK